MPGPTPSEPRHPVRAWPTSYAIAAVVFAVIDLVWLGVVAQPLYQDQLGHLLADEFNLVPAAAFYFLYWRRDGRWASRCGTPRSTGS